MFETILATAVLPAHDLDRARRWWAEVLGREPVGGDPDGETLFYEIGGVPVMVYRTGFAGTAQNTAFNLLTDDLDRDMAALRAAGVAFHEYALPELTTVDGVAELGDERAAWFSDSEGNIFSLGQPAGDSVALVERLRSGSGPR
ncbi:VOC family protein [Agromyces mediolanus]|uniref:VOC family protein n=1 Tax=Agromyces mediolanus TaxID=41986 RepID=UPI003836F9A4